MDSHLKLVAEARENAQREAFADGYEKGRTVGAEELRAKLQIDVDWSLAQELLDRLLFEEPDPVYAEDAVAQALQLAISWRKGRDMAFWTDVERYLHREHRSRMRKMREGELHQKEVLDFIEGLMMLPRLAARIEQKYHGAPDNGSSQFVEVNADA